MKIGDRAYRTIWPGADGVTVEVIDQTRLPHELVIMHLSDLAAACRAIRDMHVRGAPLIGVTAAYGMCLALRRDPSDAAVETAAAALLATRPTAVNLRWGVDQIRTLVANVPTSSRAEQAFRHAAVLADDDVATCRAIGQHGLPLLRAAWERAGRSRPVQVLTHCNAGWLCAVDWGTALAPIYAAHDAGVPIHVWVDETRPRNQGMLTAWELGQHGVPHTIVTDNAGGHLMQRGQVDLCITGTDRTTARGDVCNKIGTYLKALAARAHAIPFYVALPGASIDWTIEDGLAIPIEERAPSEVTTVIGRGGAVIIAPSGSPAANPAFDVTPAALVTGLVTERGVTEPAGLRALYGR